MMFVENGTEHDIDLLKKFKEVTGYDRNVQPALYITDQTCHQYIELFQRIHCYNEDSVLANFSMFPIFKQKLQHIRIDTKSLHSLMGGFAKTQEIVEDFLNRQRFWWSQSFDLAQHETISKKFGYQILTDGVSVSALYYNKLKAKPAEPAPRKNKKETTAPIISQEMIDKYHARAYTQEIGGDPGHKLI